ncbi:MAG: hypothetical protein ACI9MR_002020 [Myxococcota bacterium]|jgi:uncharacterized protein YbjT (DUF2867 family)
MNAASPTKVPKVVVAGATGFVGRALGPLLAERFEDVRGLTRSAEVAGTQADGYTFYEADLFSMLDCEKALEGATHIIYLAHSMMPTARLTQGSFRDMDLICADNMARAARHAGVQHIIYLGGIVPADVPSDDFDAHLASKLEVERVLGAYGVPVTALRAGVIIGAQGSSFEIIRRLVRRLPRMICPGWTQVQTQPVGIDDVVRLLAFCVGSEAVKHQHYDVGCSEAMTFRDMLARTATLMGLKRRIYNVRERFSGVSQRFVALLTGAPRALVRPLVEGLRHARVADDDQIYRLAGFAPQTFDDAIKTSLNAHGVERASAFRGARGSKECVVRSVQRLPLPAGRDAYWAAQHYVRWLPGSLRPFLKIVVKGEHVSFRALLWPKPILLLQFSPDRSHPDRQLFYIRGGSLVILKGRGRLELREVPGEDTLIAAIHDLYPRLPWFLYVYTQAPVHKRVMLAFGRQLTKLGGADPLTDAEREG